MTMDHRGHDDDEDSDDDEKEEGCSRVDGINVDVDLDEIDLNVITAMYYTYIHSTTQTVI